MANLPVQITKRKTRGGVEIISIGRSERGTKFFMDSLVVMTAGLSKEEARKQVDIAIARVLGDNYPTR